jgi:hypothetical protein
VVISDVWLGNLRFGNDVGKSSVYPAVNGGEESSKKNEKERKGTGQNAS